MVWPLIVEALEATGAVSEGAELGTLIKAVPRPLSSRALASASYAGGTLTIVMRDGTVCTYDDVPEDVYDDLVGAASPGGYFNARIRGQY